MQRTERRDITSELKYPWIIFGDGYMAQLIEIVPGKDMKNIDVFRLRLLPTGELVKKHKIGLEMMDENMTLQMEYPQEMIKPLSLDPAFSVYFCFVNFWGEPTSAVQFWKGKLDEDMLMKIKAENNRLRAENAYLTEKYEKAKTNIYKYVREDIMGIANEMQIQMLGPAQQPQLTTMTRTEQ